MTKAIQIKGLEIGRGMPKICVPLMSPSKKELCAEAERAKKAAPDLVEWRSDFFEDLNNPKKCAEMAAELAKILGDIPLLFTIRTKEEGGNADLSTKEYAMVNETVAASKYVDLVDVEVFGNAEEKRALIKKLQERKVKVVASSHDFAKTDTREILLERFKKMDETGADILKMAVMPKNKEDVSAIMQVTREMQENFTEKPLVSMSMGKIGEISRIEGEKFGSSITFGAIERASAPGQIPIETLREKLLKVHKLRKRSKEHEKF